MKKFYAFIAAILFAGSMMAAEVTVTITSADFAAMSAAGSYAYSADGLKLSVTRGLVSGEEIRIYQGETLTLKAGKITKVVLTCAANGTTKKGPGCFGEGAPEGYTFEADGPTGTWEGEATTLGFTATDKQVVAKSIAVTYEPAETGQNIEVTLDPSNASVSWVDNCETKGWWEYNAETDSLLIELSNLSSAEAAGTYTAAELDPDYAYLKTAEGDSINLTAGGSLTVAIDEAGTVTITGTLVGDDENNYILNLKYWAPTAETEETLVVEEAQFIDMAESAGLWGFIGTSEDGTYVQILFAGDEAAPGTYTEEDFDTSYGTFLAIGGETLVSIYSGTVVVVVNEDGSITVTADLLGANSTLYHITMTVPADEEQGIENVVLTEKAQKVVVDGAVYVIRDNKMFNIHGAQVR